MSAPLQYRFYAYDTELKLELDCLLYFDMVTALPDLQNSTITLDLTSHTSADLAQLAFNYFHDEYSINIDRVSISAFLNTIKIWAVPSTAYAHFSVSKRDD